MSEIIEILSDDKKIYISKENFPLPKLLQKQKQREQISDILSEKFPNYCIDYSENGAPFLPSFGEFISISHSYPYAVLAVSEREIGIDIERKQERILNIKHKFINSQEELWLRNKKSELDYLTAIWSIKEALFKIHSSKKWSFKDFYFVEEFDFQKDAKNIKCSVLTEESSSFYSAELKNIDNYLLAIVQKKDTL